MSCTYTLLTGKDGTLCSEMLRAIQQQMLRLNVPFVVRDIMSDFEYEAIGAARAVFEANVNFHGCFFITANPPDEKSSCLKKV